MGRADGLGRRSVLIPFRNSGGDNQNAELEQRRQSVLIPFRNSGRDNMKARVATEQAAKS